MTTAVVSVFDIAFWFSDTAENHQEHMQPQKMHRLLFMSQAYYSVAYEGKKLMPAIFIADELGPIEPNIYRAFAKGRPDIEAELFIPEDVEMFLESIWRRFGNLTPERLSSLAKDTKAYKQAFAKAPKSEISLEAMRLSFIKDRAAPGIEQVIRPKVMRTQSGTPVAVKAWMPKSTKPGQPTKPKSSTMETLDQPTKSPFANQPAKPKRRGGRPWPPAEKRKLSKF